MCAPIRPFASLFCVAFHLMNSSLFSIGMFPWLCLTQMPLFFERDWPRKWILFFTKGIQSENVKLNTITRNTKTQNKFWKRVITSFLLIYCSLQAALPYSHSLTPGYNTWTDGPYGYSWDMMIHAWNTVRTSVRVRDNPSGQEYFVDAKAFSYSDRWSKHADMAHQFAKCIEKHVITDSVSNHQSALKSDNISIYFDVWCSLNGRFQQRIFDPYVDILDAPWSPWQPTNWVLPIISSLITKRMEIREIRKSISNINNSSDVMFFADFPGFEVEHKVPDELKDVSLVVIQGDVILHTNNNSSGFALQKGMKVPIDSGERHRITTLGKMESATMYEFTNTSLVIEDNDNTPRSISLVPHMWIVLCKRCLNYDRFIRNIVYSIWIEIRFLILKHLNI